MPGLSVADRAGARGASVERSGARDELASSRSSSSRSRSTTTLTDATQLARDPPPPPPPPICLASSRARALRLPAVVLSDRSSLVLVCDNKLRRRQHTPVGRRISDRLRPAITSSTRVSTAQPPSYCQYLRTFRLVDCRSPYGS